MLPCPRTYLYARAYVRPRSQQRQAARGLLGAEGEEEGDVDLQRALQASALYVNFYHSVAWLGMAHFGEGS